jgi:hypothetical protein
MSPVPYDPVEGPPIPAPGEAYANSVTRHGTTSGWRKHYDLEEEACDACRAAKARYDWERKNATEVKRMARNRAAAQQKAITRLTRAHPEEYKKYYEEEKERWGVT